MDANAAAQQLLQNQKFVELFQRAMGGGDGSGGADKDGTEDFLASMPKEGDPAREAWLRSLQSRLQAETTKEAKKDLEQVHSDESGQWMFVLPEPGFCLKTNLAGGLKVFINVCQHPRIAEPVPMEPEQGDESDGETRFRIPISCGSARPDKDKSGKPCKVYDVIVNPTTVQRCGQDNEFRRFVAALCMQWIKQKSEPTLNADEFRNLNFKCKGVLEPQRIRLSVTPKDANAMGDEIKLPTSSAAATAPSQVNGVQGKSKLVEEMQPASTRGAGVSGEAKEDVSTTAAAAAAEAAPAPAVTSVTAEGTYDWSTHRRAALNPYFKESVPARYSVVLFLPGIQSIREVEVRIERRAIACYYIDAVMDAEDEAENAVKATNGIKAAPEPFLRTTLDYPVSDDVLEAKYVRKTNTLKLKVAVQLPDEAQAPATKPERDVTELEDEEQRRVQEARDRQWAAATALKATQAQEEAAIMEERRHYVANLSAVQAGDVPPVVREEVDQMPREQLPAMLHRLEGRIRKGDSVDALLDKLPAQVLESLIDYIREKLSLEPRPKRVAPPLAPEEVAAGKAGGTSENTEDSPPASKVNASGKAAAAATSEAPVEFNAMKQSEALFGVAFHNRYLFALD